METLQEQFDKEKAAQSAASKIVPDSVKEIPVQFGNPYNEEFRKNLDVIQKKNEKRGKTARKGRAQK